MSDDYLQPGMKCPRVGCDGYMVAPDESDNPALVHCWECHYTQGLGAEERDYKITPRHTQPDEPRQLRLPLVPKLTREDTR